MPLGGERALRAARLLTTARRLVDVVGPTLVLLVIFWWWLALAVQGSPEDWAFDFRQFWQGGKDVVDGVSPYPSSALLATAGDHLGPEGIRDVFRFPYPAGAAVVLAPFGVLEFEAAAAAWSALLIVALLLALWILQVRDWRVLAIVVTSVPVISSVRLGTLTPVLVLLAAVLWRWRDRRWIAGGALALAVSLKLFLWPLVVWLAATRRWAAAAIAAAGAASFTLVAWAAIGFAGIGLYPELARRLMDVVGDRGYSLVALGAASGLPSGAAEALPWLLGIPLLAVLVLSALNGVRERASFSLAVVTTLAITPIVWLHYFALLVVPLALVRPLRLWPWIALWLFWLTSTQESQGDLWRVLVALLATSAVAAWVWRSARAPEAPA